MITKYLASSLKVFGMSLIDMVHSNHCEHTVSNYFLEAEANKYFLVNIFV